MAANHFPLVFVLMAILEVRSNLYHPYFYMISC